MKEVANKLRNMIGKTWVYKAQTLLFQGIEIVNKDEIKLYTSDKEIVLTNPSMAHFFIEDCKPGENLPEKSKEQEKNDEVMASLKGVLMENINNIRRDPAYIPQAQAISKQVQTLINLTTLEININKKADV